MTRNSTKRSWIGGCKECQTIVNVAGVIVTLFIGYIALSIDSEIQNKSNKEFRMERSMSLFQGYNNNRFIENLQYTSGIIWHHLYLSEKNYEKMYGDTNGFSVSRYLVHIYNNNSVIDLAKIRNDLDNMANMVNVIYSCMNDEKSNNDGVYCDRNTITLLFGDLLAEFFYIYSPMLYCDDYVRQHYINSNTMKELTELVSLYYRNILNDSREIKDFPEKYCDDYLKTEI